MRPTRGCSTRRWPTSARRLAHAVGVVTELVLAERGPDVVLVSLARAGTPVGVLMRRWAAARHGLDLPHYAVSIVRGRGIDAVALRYLAAHHDPARVVFVDGWTGKGAITRELAAALARATPRFSPRPGGARRPRPLRAHVRHPRRLPDPVRLPELHGVRAGVPHRPQRPADPARQFHGAKFYARARGRRRLRRFLDAVAAQFADATCTRRPAPRAATARPTCAGLGERRADHGGSTASTTSTSSSPASARPPGCCCAGCRGRCWSGPERRPPTSPTCGCWPSSAACRSRRCDDLAYSCVGLIHPRFTRGATGADGRAVRAG